MVSQTLTEACSSYSGAEEGKPLGHCTVLVDTALVAVTVAAAHCSTAHAIQDTPVGHSHGQQVADAVAAGTDQVALPHIEVVAMARRMEVVAMARRMEVVAMARRRWSIAVSMEV